MSRCRLLGPLISMVWLALAATAGAVSAQQRGPATIDQFAALIDSAAEALDAARGIERSLRDEADHQKMFVATMQANSIDLIGCTIDDPNEVPGQPCSGVNQYIPSLLSDPDSAAYVHGLTAQRDDLDRRINEILKAIRGADYAGMPNAWSKAMIACAATYRDTAVRCLTDAWRKRPPQAGGVPRDSTRDPAH